MSRKVVIVLIILAIASVSVLFLWKWVFKKSDVSVASQKTEYEIASDLLAHEFEENEETANAKYLGKVIAVSGIVNSVTEDEQSLSVYLKKDEDLSGVMCTFSKNTIPSGKVKAGDNVIIKGICDGYLMDVTLNKCSLEK
jgi:hypothetical protein